MNTKVIYTCLTGGYDDLLQPTVIDNNFDYICFSNDITEDNVGVWQIKKIPFETDDNSRLSRYPKILPHKVLSEYGYSVYMDANIQIIGQEFYDIVNKKIEEGVLIAQVSHLERDCVYEEIRTAYCRNKVDFFSAYKTIKYLKSGKYPKHNGLYENNIILRNNKKKKVVNISENWWNEFCRYSKRDQFSLVYVYWKAMSYKPDLLFGEKFNARNVDFLSFTINHKNQYKTIPYMIRRICSVIISKFLK